MDKVFLSIVIPSYNETENLKRGVLGQVRDYLSSKNFSWEVIVSEDASPDLESRKLAKDFCENNKNFVFLQNEHGGKAVTVWRGIQKARGEIVLFTDMDQSTPIAELEKLLPFFEQGYDVAIGSRGLERQNFSLFRKLASFIFRNFRRALLLGHIKDTQAGFKALRTSVALELFPVLTAIKNSGPAVGWTVSSFDVELLVAALDRGYRVAEVPISWEDRDESVAKAKERKQGKFVKESIDMIKEVLQVKYNLIRGLYKK